MVSNSVFESQGMRLLRDLFSHGKRIFSMQDIKAVASAQNIPLNQMTLYTCKNLILISFSKLSFNFDQISILGYL